LDQIAGGIKIEKFAKHLPELFGHLIEDKFLTRRLEIEGNFVMLQ
jgi:tRNA 2-selenouridine synthase SelU